jgi:hydrogenase expression/formation protein HypE
LSLKVREGLMPETTRPSGKIVLGHGSGGRMMQELIASLFRRAFDNPILNSQDDAAEVPFPGQRLAFTTDSYVVTPLVFPGGDIGKLAVCGTVNDLAVKGAIPLALSASFILEEGLEIALLEKIVSSMAQASREAGVSVVTGDTKVVERGKADGMFITTSGVGMIPEGRNVAGSLARPGDAVLVNGPIAEHGIAVMNARMDFGLKGDLKSDCAALYRLIESALSSSDKVHAMRDPTRGGVAATLNEIAAQSGVGIILEEARIPVRSEVRAACELLGLDPLYVANEGKVLVILENSDSGKALEAMRRHPLGKGAASIGEVVRKPKGVFLKTHIGGLRPLILLEGEQLPRIC